MLSMACDVMSVRLHSPLVRVLGVVEDTLARLVVGVESTLMWLRCPACGFECRRVHDRRDMKIRDLDVSGRNATLVWSRRMRCDNCDSRFSGDHPAFEGGLTARLARALVAYAKVMTLRAAARSCGPGRESSPRRREGCRVVSVDETSLRCRHRYVIVIVNADTGKTLAMVPHDISAALSAFLAQQRPPLVHGRQGSGPVAPATAESRELTTCSRSCSEQPTASPTRPARGPRPPCNMTPAVPATPHPTKSRSAYHYECEEPACNA